MRTTHAAALTLLAASSTLAANPFLALRGTDALTPTLMPAIPTPGPDITIGTPNVQTAAASTATVSAAAGSSSAA